MNNIKWPLSAIFVFAFSLLSITKPGYAQEVIKVESAPTVSPLLELYTSEGCSSCPGAEEWLGRLGAALDETFHAIPLAFHVDYWDRLGWKDPFADPAFTKRQQNIAAINGQNTLYTPQFVVTGAQARGANDVLDKIVSANKQEAPLSISLNLTALDKTTLKAAISIDSKYATTESQVFVAVYENNIFRQIGAGENKVKTLRHNYVVRHWSAASDGFAEQADELKKLTIPLQTNWSRENLGVAIVVLDKESGKTLQAVNTPIARLFES